jgi:hypothetical protein
LRPRYRAAPSFADAAEIAKALRGQTVALCFVSMHFLLRCLRANAKMAGITLPQRLTIARGEPGFKEWRCEIDAYRASAGARLARAKPARPPVRKRLLPT